MPRLCSSVPMAPSSMTILFLSNFMILFFAFINNALVKKPSCAMERQEGMESPLHPPFGKGGKLEVAPLEKRGICSLPPWKKRGGYVVRLLLWKRGQGDFHNKLFFRSVFWVHDRISVVRSDRAPKTPAIAVTDFSGTRTKLSVIRTPMRSSSSIRKIVP